MDVARVCVCLVGLAAGQQAGAGLETPTPVPILRYIDSQNADGSYTYGFEGADGTYKLETRLADGSVRGKYGYYDPEGQLRETTYGSTKETGFEPRVAGFQQPRAPVVDTRLNEVEESVVRQEAAPRRFANFSPRKAAGEARRTASARAQHVKIVNGRRAVLKRRLVKRPPTARPEEVVNRDNLRARLQQLKQQQQQATRRESFRSLPSFTPTAPVGPEEPFVSYGKEAGSYTISY